MNKAFLLGCIPTRLTLVYIVKNFPQYHTIIGIITGIIAIGFMYIYMFDLRKTGPEVGWGKIWWNHLRPIHSVLYGVSAYMLLKKMGEPWKVLLLDVFIGLVAHLQK